MKPPRVPRCRVRLLRFLVTIIIVCVLAALGLMTGAEIQTTSAQIILPPVSTFKNFESPQVHPLALTPDGTRLVAVNSPNATLSIFQLRNGATPVLTAEIPVGLEPTSVAVRADNREAWVTNWLSDSISIVDLATGNVTRTIDVGDEPTDILFAGLNREMAFVCVSGRSQIKVFDPNAPDASPQVIDIFAKQPRALARDANGGHVFVSILESGNQTTIVPEAVVRANGGLPPPSPAMAAGLPAAPNTSLIVKWNGAAWLDEIGRNWNPFVTYTLADIDLVVIDAGGTAATLGAQVRGVGTHLGNMAFDPTTSRLFVTNLESTNETRFEPNLRARFQKSRVSTLDISAGGVPANVNAFDLNPHVDVASSAGSDAERAQSLAMPADIVRASDGTIYVAAISSARVGFLAPSGTVAGRIAVGQGPTGLALDEARQKLYVLNRFDQTLSIVDTNAKAQIAQIGIGFNPEPAEVRNGRRFLYDANFSAHGTVSCASCHLGGHRDGLAWDLGNPQGQLTSGFPQHHPMKGPMSTQSLRGIIGTEPLHWRGDRRTLSDFNVAFTDLLGSTRPLAPAEMAAFEAFVRTLSYPPNPNENLDRTFPAPATGPSAQRGAQLFQSAFLNGLSCNTCHRALPNFDIGSDRVVFPGSILQEPQNFKVPQLRGIYQKVGMATSNADNQRLSGFGFIHDGTLDTLFKFISLPVFTGFAAGEAGNAQRRDIEAFLLSFDSGIAPAVGVQVTVNADNKTSTAVADRLNLLIQQSAPGTNPNCDLIVRGIYGGGPRGFQHVGNGQFQPDSTAEAPVSLQTLLQTVAPGAELTFTGVPRGAGRRMGIDRDGNNTLNDDEPRTSVSISGRVTDAAGNGLGGIGVTLSGTQTAFTQTDAQGRYTFNFISTVGTHIVTPAGGGQTFAPPSRTFTNPTWNQAGYFIAPAGSENAADASQFFVRQHYGDFLNREPDASGLSFWMNQIEECRNPAAQCSVEIRRINASAAFYLSIEFQQTGFLVYRLTKASFDGRMPRYSEFFPDTQRLGRNVIVGVGNWEQQLETNKQAFLNGWVTRPAFLAKYPIGLSPQQFVDTLIANAGILPGEIDPVALVVGLTNGTETRATVLRKIAENPKFIEREKNRAFVLMQYFGYLRRNPEDPPEETLDLQGFNFWLSKLNQFGGDFVSAEMVKAFIISGEYRRRFGTQ